MGDIGTHAAHLAEYISGLKIEKLCADLSIMVQGRALDDDGNMLLRFDNGATGVLYASQVAAGEENALKIRVYGEKGGIEWAQQEPNTLIVKWLDQPIQVLPRLAPLGIRYRQTQHPDTRRPPRRLSRSLRQSLSQFCPYPHRPPRRDHPFQRSAGLPRRRRRRPRHGLYRKPHPQQRQHGKMDPLRDPLNIPKTPDPQTLNPKTLQKLPILCAP